LNIRAESNCRTNTLDATNFQLHMFYPRIRANEQVPITQKISYLRLSETSHIKW